MGKQHWTFADMNTVSPELLWKSSPGLLAYNLQYHIFYIVVFFVS